MRVPSSALRAVAGSSRSCRSWPFRPSSQLAAAHRLPRRVPRRRPRRRLPGQAAAASTKYTQCLTSHGVPARSPLGRSGGGRPAHLRRFHRHRAPRRCLEPGRPFRPNTGRPSRRAPATAPDGRRLLRRWRGSTAPRPRPIATACRSTALRCPPRRPPLRASPRRRRVRGGFGGGQFAEQPDVPGRSAGRRQYAAGPGRLDDDDHGRCRGMNGRRRFWLVNGTLAVVAAALALLGANAVFHKAFGPRRRAHGYRAARDRPVDRHRQRERSRRRRPRTWALPPAARSPRSTWPWARR